MLDWLTGASRSHDMQSSREGLYTNPTMWFTRLLTSATANDQSFANEPPETPAPLFAVRAFKSAFFGTPVLEAQEEEEEEEHDLQLPLEEEIIEPIPVCNNEEIRNTGKSTATSIEDVVLKPDFFSSPAKGILLTPGTAAARRKTVSFGILADLSKEFVEVNSTVTGVSSYANNTSALKPARSLQKARCREAGLRRTLFENRGKKPEPRPVQADLQHNTDAKSVEQLDSEDFGDVTTDLKHPLSKSGQHWKREYQRDHESSKTEMRKLIKYNQVAKSYAVKRDAVALDLSEKLKRASERTTEMEARVSQLASQLLNSAEGGKSVPTDQANLLTELATQTAYALRYKQKAERYRVVIQQEKSSTGLEKLRTIIPCTSSALYQPGRLQDQYESHSSDEGLAPVAVEIEHLRKAAEAAEDKAAILERENLALKNTLARVKQEMKAYEVRHQVRETRRKRKDEKAEAQRRALKEELSKYNSIYRKDDTMTISGQPHECDLHETAPRSRTLKQQTVAENLNLRYQQNASSSKVRQNDELLRAVGTTKSGLSGYQGGTAHITKKDELGGSPLPESADIWTAPTRDTLSGKDAGLHYPDMPRSEPVQLNEMSPLAELKQILIEGRKHGESVSPVPTGKSSANLEHHGGLTENIKSPTSARPFRKLDPQSEIQIERQNSQPRVPQIVGLRRGFSQGAHQAPSRTNTLSRILGDSRASSLSGRPPLPPDRVEAAKRRLEQKNAETVKGQLFGKENWRP